MVYKLKFLHNWQVYKDDKNDLKSSFFTAEEQYENVRIRALPLAYMALYCRLMSKSSFKSLLMM